MWIFGDLTSDYVSFTTVEHDYTYADPEQGGVTLTEIGDLETPSQYAYIQGLAGLMGILKIDEDALESLQQRVKNLGYTHIALHKAEAQVTMVDACAAAYEESFAGSGV